jgi:hypothetical protein
MRSIIISCPEPSKAPNSLEHRLTYTLSCVSYALCHINSKDIIVSAEYLSVYLLMRTTNWK